MDLHSNTKRTTNPNEKRPSFGDYHPDDVVPRKVAAALLGVSPRTLEDWARLGTGPVRRKYGTARSSRVLFAIRDLLAFIESQASASTTNGIGSPQ